MRRLWTFEPADYLGMGFGIWIREYRARDISHNGIYGLLSLNLKSKIQNLKLVVAAVVIVTTAVAHAGAALKWQDDWQRVVEAAKKEGQVVVGIGGETKRCCRTLKKNFRKSSSWLFRRAARKLSSG